MSSSSLALVLALVCLGSTAWSDDRFVEQREVTFDISPVMQEIRPQDSHMLQRALDTSDLLKDFKEQHNPVFSPRASWPHIFPRLDLYRVQFPLARPSSENLQAICLHGDHRPRYPKSYFPRSGFGGHVRQGDAVNTLEAWFGTCCSHNQTQEVTLCCATQAWEQSLSNFCNEEFSVKTSHYLCCKRSNSERSSCFNNHAPNPNYEPTEVMPVQNVAPKATFNFDRSSCHRTSVNPRSVRGEGRRNKEMKPPTSLNVDFLFPPAAPTEANIESLCLNQKFRPLYNIKCLTGLGYDLVARQAKTINRLEKGFKQCCKRKQDVLSCAHKSWQVEITKFCFGGKGKKIDFPCCSGESPNVQLECFQNISTDHEYNKTAITESLSLSSVCDSHKVITSKFPVGFPLKSLVKKCCPQSPVERSTCIPQTLKEMFEAMCSSRKGSPPTVRRCCRTSNIECFNNILMDAITRATSFSHQKKKKCPVS